MSDILKTLTPVVTASVSATSSLNFTVPLPANVVHLMHIKVEPSVQGVTSQLQIFVDTARAAGDLLWSTDAFVGDFETPVQNDGGTITTALAGLIVPYWDTNGTKLLHCKVFNNDSQAKTFTVTVKILQPLMADNSTLGIAEFPFAIEMEELASDPAAPAANKGVFYLRDTGGKTEMVVRFPTGAIQQIAIEP